MTPCELRAGYGHQIITPPLGLDLTGFGFYLERHAECVLDDLYVRALSLSSGGTRLLLITCDLLGFTVADADRLRRAVAEDVGVPVSHVLLACTHTHAGPASQPMEGLGTRDVAYLDQVAAMIRAAARLAVADERPATVAYRMETVEPIGYNRRNGAFAPIDPVLKYAVFTRADRKLYLLNYACHPITLGASSTVTADWPGAAARALEADGHAALVFQGCCGDINPVSWLNRGGQGTPEDIALAGSLLARRALLAEPFATPVEMPYLRAVERRISLPLTVLTPEAIASEAGRVKAIWPGGDRFFAWWREQALAVREAQARHPCLEIPVQAMAVGQLRLIALAGEVFSAYSTRLRAQFPALITVGYANGNVGYLPTEDAYALPTDYACYTAPKFYAIFPFTPAVESITVAACVQVLRAVS